MTPTVSEPVWEMGAPGPLAPLDDVITADVCVVGLGGSGLVAVAEVLAQGGSVVGLDGGRIAGGAAGRNGGFLLAGAALTHHRAVEALGRSRATRLYRLTLDEIDRMHAETPDVIRRAGSLRVASSPDEAADCDAHRSALVADGFRVEPYAGPEGEGLLLPDDGAFDPLARCRALAATAVAAGARLFETSPVVALRPGGVTTADGEVRCRSVVVAVDGGLEDLVPSLAGRVRTARLQMLATAPAFDVTIDRPVYARWGYDYWQQLPGRRIALGGCRDLAVDDEWGAPALPSAAVQVALDQTLRHVIGTNAPVTHRWAGRSAYTSDLLPVFDEVAHRVFVTGGYSGHGNVIGSLCGRAAAQLALAGASDLIF